MQQFISTALILRFERKKDSIRNRFDTQMQPVLNFCYWDRADYRVEIVADQSMAARNQIADVQQSPITTSALFNSLITTVIEPWSLTMCPDSDCRGP
jgi:hypothetical protein